MQLTTFPEIWAEHKKLQDEAIRLNKRARALAMELPEESLLLEVGQRVVHSTEGAGYVKEASLSKKFGRPIMVVFDSGETHRYSYRSATAQLQSAGTPATCMQHRYRQSGVIQG